MFIPETTRDITDLLNSLPGDVSRVLGMPEETLANATLREETGFSEGDLVRLNDFYLTVIAKKNPLSDVPVFLREGLGVADSAKLRDLLVRFAERLSWYGDYFPDLPMAAKEWGVPYQNGDPIIMKVRRDLAAEAAAETTVSGSVSAASVKERLPLLSAIGKYPKLGEQSITRERIRVKNQADPVRPSLANWIRSYRDELGVGYHEPMLRGKFIFDSENGKRLSAEERERLNLLLRSMEENIPLEIDPSVPEIVFPELSVSKSVAPSSRPTPPIRPQPVAPLLAPPAPRQATAAPAPGPVPPQAPPRKPVSFAPTPPKDLPIAGGSISFSSSHALPVESEREGDFSIRRAPVVPLRGLAVPKDPAAGVQVGVPEPDMNPFHIHPVSARGSVSVPSQDVGRVVDLRGKGPAAS